MFSRFLTNKGYISRLKEVVTTGRTIEEWSDLNNGDIMACIQPVSEEVIAMGGGDFYNTYTIYFPINTDVQAGDKYIVDDVEFLIKGVQVRPYGLRQKHIQASALKK